MLGHIINKLYTHTEKSMKTDYDAACQDMITKNQNPFPFQVRTCPPDGAPECWLTRAWRSLSCQWNWNWNHRLWELQNQNLAELCLWENVADGSLQSESSLQNSNSIGNRYYDTQFRGWWLKVIQLSVPCCRFRMTADSRDRIID